MPTVGERLRRAREEQALTVYQVSDFTKIKTEHIRALEENRFDVFPAPVYLRGFVRNYATALKLDPEQLLEELEAAIEHRDASLAGVGRRFRRGLLDILTLQFSKINWRIALPLLGALLLVVGSVFGYRAWVSYQSRDPLAGLGPGMYQPAQPSPGEMLPVPSAE